MKINPIKVAQFWAAVKHDKQTYSGLPYTHHLAAVAAVIERFGAIDPVEKTLASPMWIEEMNERMGCAAWLHDTIEDCGVKAKEIAEIFGDDVAALVSAVTNEKGENRKVRAALTYPKIRKAGRYAVRLKLADRIANVEHGGKLVDMYKGEYEDFRRALYTAGENDDMWAHLDSLLGG